MDLELHNHQFHGLLSKEDGYIRVDYLSAEDASGQLRSKVCPSLSELEIADGSLDSENSDVDSQRCSPVSLDQCSSMTRKKHRIKWREMICEWAYKGKHFFDILRTCTFGP
jgi:hypothetical protein